MALYQICRNEKVFTKMKSKLLQLANTDIEKNIINLFIKRYEKTINDN